MVSDEKLSVNLIEDPLYMTSCDPLASFRILFYLLTVYYDVTLRGYLWIHPVWILLSSLGACVCIYMSISSIKSESFCTLFLQTSFFFSFSLPPFHFLSPSFSAISEIPIMHVLDTLHVLTCSNYRHPTPYFHFSLANFSFCLNVLLNPLSEFFTLIVVLFKSKIFVLFFLNSFQWYSGFVSTLFSVFFNSLSFFFSTFKQLF